MGAWVQTGKNTGYVKLHRSILVVGILALGQCGAEAKQPQKASTPPSKESQVSSPPTVSVVRLTNGSVLQGKVLRREGGKVILELPDVGQMTFATSEVASMEDVPADAVSKLTVQETEAAEGLVYVNGQWTTPRTTQPLRSQKHYYYHYYPATEKGLDEAQRALNRATKREEIQSLKETIQQLRKALAERQEEEREDASHRAEVEAKKSKVSQSTTNEPKSGLEKSNDAVERDMAADGGGSGKKVTFQQTFSDPYQNTN